MARIEILVEERSMREFLSIVLPKILLEHWVLNKNYFIRHFDGKNDLQKNVPNKIKVLSNWRNESVGIVIIQDQDDNDCKILKQKLVRLCEENGSCPFLIRIACRELESWYVGDLRAIANAYPTFRYQKFINKAKFRDPDTCNAEDLKKILPELQKISSAKKIAPFIDIEHNKSASFMQTILGIKSFFNRIEEAEIQ